MSTSMAESNARKLVRIEIDGTAALSKELVSDIEVGLARAEDQGPHGLLAVHVLGARDRARLSAWPGAANVQLVSKWERVLRRLEYGSITSLVFASGACSVLALELLLTADYRGASPDVDVDLLGAGGQSWPGMWLYRLVQQVGVAHSRRLLLQKRLAVEKALSLDILDVTSGEDGTFFSEAAAMLAHRSSADRAVRRRLMLDATATGYDEALGAHLAACDRLLRRELSVSSDNDAALRRQTDECSTAARRETRTSPGASGA